MGNVAKGNAAGTEGVESISILKKNLRQLRSVRVGAWYRARGDPGLRASTA